ncbi:hypothetical protein [Dyella nitratireducens]|uniref:Uncharacterized protein n=1 Tax=Dyella nitratireducens TaxID=1849580 RepID=A0ABQ1FIL5_9GAMM|nr:hypothetical protein [Dyella nitratireducens]GGA16423.1 hypothetical protein GCM10010981_00060 [Dyella nitratireducens]GLQ44934.1 hypothetical protein GCM10007902_47840 [Dyella nitratireducens]
MKKPAYGPSLYYATDKNIFDALNEHKVDLPTIIELFEHRNIVVSKKTDRVDLARYFSRLTHDYHDNQSIAARLGVASRRERITSMAVNGIAGIDDITKAIEQMKAEMESVGDVVTVTRAGENLSVNIHYTKVDYKRNEFNQLQVRDGTVDFVRSGDRYIVRNTQNDYVNAIRDMVLERVEKNTGQGVSKDEISLFDVPFHKQRTKFFLELMNSLPDYSRRDVTDVYTFKPKPDPDDEAEDDIDTHVERVALRGNGVTRSEILNGLLDDRQYYICRVGWATAELKGIGNVYDIEAMFAEPKDCTGFSFLLRGVYPMEDGKVSSRKRTPLRAEVERISSVVEDKARELMEGFRKEISKQTEGDET